MSRAAEYEDQLDFPEEGTQSQQTARRTRRRRRHGKKQVFTSSCDGASEDARGRWLPPPSATTLTLAQLGIHVPQKKIQDASMTLAQLGIHVAPPAMPPKASVEGLRRNVVTWSDLDIAGCIPRSAPSAGSVDYHNSHNPSQRVSCVPTSAPTWHRADERPRERILSVPTPQVAVSLANSLTMGSFQVAPRLQSHQYIQGDTRYPHQMQLSTQPQPAWSAEADPTLRHWICVDQYGTQSVYHSSVCDASGMSHDANGLPLTTAPPPPSHPAPACTAPVAAVSAPPPTAAPDCIIPGEIPTAALVHQTSEDDKLETLLQHLAVESGQYED